MADEHSKTPWNFDYPEHDPSNVIIWQDDAENRICFMAHDGTDGNERGVANAAFIVRAVNCHAKLVEALEGVIRVADRETVEFDAARAAVAEAKGQTP